MYRVRSVNIRKKSFRFEMCHFDPRSHIHAKSKIPEKKTPIVKNFN